MNALRWLLPRLPLPMLALAASYGVYQFALLFVPQWVAVVQAAAFELTYIGLATLDAKGNLQRRKAIAISLGAVIVSVLYNWLAGFFHRNPETLIGLDLWKEAGLAFLHGAPLAIVAYLVSDLLLHNNAQEAEPSLQDASEPDTIEAVMQTVRIEQPAPQPVLQNLIADLQPMEEQTQSVQVDASPMQVDERASYLDSWPPDDLAAKRPASVSRGAWQAWTLCKYQGMSQAEVAAIMGKSISTISRYCSKVDEAMPEEVTA